METEYVFLARNQLAQRWQALKQEQQTSGQFTIGETGFGTGLNFLSAWRLWKKNGMPGRLHFVSVEKHPLSRQDLVHTLSRWDELAEFSSQLIANYPPLTPGFHRITLDQGAVSLTLVFGEAANALEQVSGTIDAWFLDGFSPAKNPAMWSGTLFSQLSRLSREGTTFATFTSASAVRKGLQAAGFAVNKAEGPGLKREICSGQWAAGPEAPGNSYSHREAPLFIYRNRPQAPGHAVVIGGGIAGTSAARALAKRHWRVTLLERGDGLAQGGSGNPVGVTFTRLSIHNNPQNRYYQQAYLYATGYIRRAFEEHRIPPGEDWNLNGVVRIAHSKKERDEQVVLTRRRHWPQEIAQPLTAQEASALLGYPCEYPALLLKTGGWLHPPALCDLLTRHTNIEVVTQCRVTDLEYAQSRRRWQVRCENSRQDCEADAVVIANSFDCARLAQTRYLPLRPVRGQLSYLPSTTRSSRLKHAVNYDGYCAPARNGFHTIGATFHPKLHDNQLRPEDHRTNINNLNHALHGFAQHLGPEPPNNSELSPDGRVGFRCQTPDYLPVIGPVPNIDYFEKEYADLKKGFLKRPFPAGASLPNLFVSVAHGSRGMTSAPFAAEILAAYLSGEPGIIDREVLNAVNPARFIIRDIKRRK